MGARLENCPRIKIAAAFFTLRPIKGIMVSRESDDEFHVLLFLCISKMLPFSVGTILKLPTIM